VRRKTPEEREYEKKTVELLAIEGIVAERELEFATLRAELDAFSIQYQLAVGALIAELDSLLAEIADITARLNPKDSTARAEAEDLRQRAEESADAMGWMREHLDDVREFHPSDELKRLYRECAKAFHPDLAMDEAEKLRRESIMADANDAYQHGDIDRLQRILQGWHESPDSVQGNDMAAELIRTIRKIAQMEERCELIAAELAALQASEIFQLRKTVENAKDEGKDLLAEMADHLHERITAEKRRLQLLNDRAVKG
jgi:hypothetical protein